MAELGESELIEKELTLRNLRLTKEVLETRRSIVRWLALSLGVLNPGESRLSAVAVLDALVHYKFVERIDPGRRAAHGIHRQVLGGDQREDAEVPPAQDEEDGARGQLAGEVLPQAPEHRGRLDAYTWAMGLYEKDYREIAARSGTR